MSIILYISINFVKEVFGIDTDKKCVTCTAYFTAKRKDSIRCSRCQEIYNRNRRNELTKAKYQGHLSAPPIPDGHIYLGEWAASKGHTLKGAQKLVAKTPHVFGAIKVRNPSGGVNVWAVPKNTAWPH